MSRSDERRQVPAGNEASASAQSVVTAEVAVAGAEADRDALPRNADQLLKESEDRFQALVEATGQLVWTMPPDGLVVDMPLWRAYTGQAVEQVQGWGWLEAVHPEDRERVQVAWSQAVAARTLFETEYRLRRQDGVYRHFFVRAVPVLGDGGEPREWVGVHTDITERKRAEEERLARLERGHEAAVRAGEMEAIFETITDGVLVFDEAGRLLKTNAAGRAILARYAPEGVYDLPAEERVRVLRTENTAGELMSLDELPLPRIVRGEVLREEQAVDVVLPALDGGRIYINVAGAPFRDADGTLIGSVCVFRDMSAQRHLYQRTHDALNALLAMAEALVQMEAEESGDRATGPESAALWKPNPMAQRLVELTRRVLGCERISITAVDAGTELQHVVAVTGLTEEQQRRWNVEQAAEVRLDEGVPPEIAARLRAGDILTFDLTQPPFRDQPNPYDIRDLLIAPMRAGEHLIGFMAVDYGGEPHTYTDDEKALANATAQLAAVVLERERLLREREEARASALALREANRRMDEFLGIASHELRTPLTVVKANVQLFLRQLSRQGDQSGQSGQGGERDAQHLTMLRRMEKQVERLDRLVSDLLDYSRIQEGKLELRVERCDLVASTREAVEEQRVAQPGRAIRLHGAADGPVWVEGDADRLGQVVTNYLTNALKYSAETEPVDVTLERRGERGERVQVAVHDRGPGMTPEQRARIWQRFYRAPGIEVQSGSGVGLGLGLHISRSLVERQGGEVGLESVPGEGSTFWFELPVEPSR